MRLIAFIVILFTLNTATATEKPKREATPHRDPVDEKPARRKDRRDNQQVVGMGDHVPAFMRREPPRVDG